MKLASLMVVALLATFVSADFSVNCPEFARHLSKGCSINNDCTQIKCQEKSLGDKELSLVIKINKCEEPVSIDITVSALGFSWVKTFQSNQKIAVPGLSLKPFGSLFAAGVYFEVDLKDTGSNLQLKVLITTAPAPAPAPAHLYSCSFQIIILTGIELLGSFKEFTRDTLANSDLPIGTFECGIVRWWKALGDLQYLLIIGAVVFIVILFVCCWCCCCRKPKPRGGVVVAQAPGAAVVAVPVDSFTIPMQTIDDHLK